MPIQAKNPTTGELLKTYEALSEQSIKERLDKAEAAFHKWRSTHFSERAVLMKKAAEELRANKQKYGEIMTHEMGKPITQAEAEVEKCAWVCEYYAENAEQFLKDDVRESDASKSYIHHAPLGPVLAVMPWNFPFWQVFRFAAPALMAGNVGVLKHASNVPGCALAIEEIFRKAGCPEGVFQTLLIGSSQVETVIANDHIRAVTLTGSSSAGAKVAEVAGRYLKKTVLELGGSDPFIVLDNVDIDTCTLQAVQGRIINSGQSCIAAKRFIVMDAIADAFEAKYKTHMAALKMGDPMNPETQIGPQARTDLRDDLHAQVERSIQQGATLLLGGKIPQGLGAFYPPTLLTNVKKGMPAYDEELFGPVAAIIRVASIEEAIQVANDTPYGLGASVWSRDIALAEQIALQIDAGAVFINGIVKSDPRLPFGGIKQSGYGHELADIGIKEFLNLQTVWVK